MTPDRWQQIDHLFHETLACEPALRESFLAAACESDDALRMEVESLLSSHKGAEQFIETPAGDVAAELLGTRQSTFEPGEKIENYRIVRLLGAGGMGEVYLADDTRLNRKVALKLLPPHYTANPDRVRRFEREARAASALNHPNIVTIYEIGKSASAHFIATEFVDGKTLRQLINEKPFTLNEMLNVAIQVAGALVGAHAAGIVHRDIKPENIMVRSDGYAKILDFGLAKLTERQSAYSETETPTLLQSTPGMVMGTVQYMSPEQARGQKVDARSDIWSLGILFYELLAGRVPFSGETPSHVMVSLMEDELPPLTSYANVPAELDRIVTKALRKKQKERYQSGNQLADDLKNLKRELQVEARLQGHVGAQIPSLAKRSATKTGAPASALATRRATGTVALQSVTAANSTSSAEYIIGGIRRHKVFAIAAMFVLVVGAIALTVMLPRRKAPPLLTSSARRSIAVLPLKPINVAKRDEVYELGIADALIYQLGSMKGVDVRPLSSTRKYTTVDQDPIAAGREQQVDYVLTANYQLASGKISITAQLINVSTGQSEEFYKAERDVGDLLATQDAIAGDLGNKLLARFATTSNGHVARRGTTNEEAYRFYLQGKNLANQRNLEDDQRAVGEFEQAIRLDPNFGRAYAGLGYAYHSLSNRPRLGELRVAQHEKAKQSVKKALELDSNLGEAYAVRGLIGFAKEWDFAAAERDLLTAIELESNNDTAHRAYALLSAFRGRFAKAMTEIETAQTIAPGTAMYERDRGRILYYSRRYDEAIVQLKRTIELKRNFASAWNWIVRAHEMKGDYAGAYHWFIGLLKLVKDERVAEYQNAHETAGWPGVRQRLLEFSKLNAHKPESSSYDMAVQYAMVGDKERAFEYLNKSVEQRLEWGVAMLNVDPQLDSIRGDPRFTELVKRLRLQ